jgi:hypothetical protein
MPQFHFSTSSCLKSIAAQAIWYWAKKTSARKLVGAKMKKVLLIESSPRGSDSYSHQAARSIVNELQRRNPGAKVIVRDLAQSPPPHVGQAFITGMYAAPE